MPLQIVHHPDYDAGFAVNHRFPMSKYPLLMEALRRRGLAEPEALATPEPAPAAWLRLAHAADYVGQVLACEVPEKIEREIGFPVGRRVSLRAQLATAGTVLAARLALKHGIACNAAGGSHHARRAQGAGFCTFNDVAVASLVLLAERAVENILVVDLDVHQGDGTADILKDEPRAFAFSMHGERNYPPRKIASDFDIALPDGTGDAAYLDRLGAVLPELSAKRRWDIVFYNAGVDVHVEDRLGRLALSDEGLRSREAMVIRHFRMSGVPLCGVIGGGYSTDVPSLAARHAILFEAAAAYA
ncbi:histone deacetylase [Mesorhizobium sp. M1C.F.Ca.ET.193.01.1.1]|uniref:histone deacetylase family protein n=1 Tax=unclassified Mesorhizobium TaxID=325217 RepID=UPI000FD3AA92|nr:MULTISPECIES: histone deacetylase [unclassified Mesorhizobium]TGT04055.1 histone deacetylase [bacterium M00.F.Ca.ET.177.01.1.1]TGQ56649.1 histone deacetylase [Mesorhizobium sp. M1C.F.Ca.ET.210.01.1.1]TGQ75417.1 histone deacetylase [Mesorhizobium sp. M1C.F.Ca.ET.212.01.1.1]TGR13825.1 histone deacetylase [Mesorhizobium sp. M1C.F.Ca.ET.204.01.1.1]TGR34080.1 histone deacetylase [Mesorhizobium sp. M1C.F.Ca.ET.196.01.1.1]